MLSPEVGAAEERKKEEAEAFAQRMNSKYNNQEQERFENEAQDKYNHQYNRHPEKTQHPDFKKHLQSNPERIKSTAKSIASSVGSTIKNGAIKSARYVQKKEQERKAYMQTDEYKQKKAEKARKRKQIVKNLQKRMNNNSNPLFGNYIQPSQPQSPQQSKRPKKQMNPLFGGTYQMPSSDFFFGPKPKPQKKIKLKRNKKPPIRPQNPFATPPEWRM